MFDAWVEHAKTALPALAPIDAVRRESDLFAYIEIISQKGETVSSSGLSGGTLSLLAYTLLPYLSTPPACYRNCSPIVEISVYLAGLSGFQHICQLSWRTLIWMSSLSWPMMAIEG